MTCPTYSCQPPPATGTSTTTTTQAQPAAASSTPASLPVTGAVVGFVVLLAIFVILAGLGLRWLGKMIGR
jgi:hypothetical protein